MTKSKQPSSMVGKRKQTLPSWLLWLLGTTAETKQPQPQRAQPANHQVQTAATPAIVQSLAALEATLEQGADASAIQAAFTALSEAERKTHWQTGEIKSYAEQMAAWEQDMEAMLSPYRTDPALSDGLALLRRTLRQPPNQPLDTAEISAHALYRIFIQEGNGDVIRFAQQVAATNTSEEIIANQDLIVQLARMFGQRTSTCVLPYIHRLKAEQAERERASVLGTDLETSEEVVISQKQRQQGLYCIGVNGTGKTTLLANLIKKDLELGVGFCLVEPHGDLFRTVLSLVPPHRLPDVILLDVMDSAFPFGMNLFQSDLPGDTNEAAKTASFLMHLFEKVWNVGTDTPRLQQVLRNISRTLLANPGMTFAEIPLLLWDDAVREKLVSNVTNTQTRLFWQQYNSKSQRDKDELSASTMNKVDAYLNEPMIANIVSQANTSINFRQIMDSSKILLIHLSPQLEEVSRLLGAAIIGRLLMAAFSRSDLLEAERRQFNFYVDEFQRFATSDWRTFLEEARKFNVPITFAHQSISQLDESLQTAATGAGTIVSFRVSGDDARLLARSYNCEPEQVQDGFEPQRAPVSDVITHLLRRGHNDPRVSAFAQRFLSALEHYLQSPTVSFSAKEWYASFDCFDGSLTLSDQQVQEGRKLLNQCLYASMSEADSNRSIPMLAIYLLAAAQRDGREFVFSPYVQSYNHGFLFGPFSLVGFDPSAAKFGQPQFVKPKRSASYIAAVAKAAKKEKWMAEAVVSMLTELRYTIEVLAHSPILVDTGQLIPKYKLRTFADQQNAIANDLSQQENYVARVKTLRGEHTIRTHPLPRLLSEAQLAERIGDIKRRMREQGLCRPAHEVEEEVRLRHEQLRQRNDAPPPSHSNGTNRRRFRPRPPIDA